LLRKFYASTMKLLSRLYDHKRSGSVATTLRNERLKLLNSLLSTLPKPIRILDVGGRSAFWVGTGLLDAAGSDVEITLINTSQIELGEVYPHPGLIYSVGDARDMREFQTKSFDVVFSNSVIEHVGNYADQALMAQEVQRLGKRYFIQTPNFYFPIEPHFVFPAFHWLPIASRVWLVTHFPLGWYGKFDSSSRAREEVESIRLLTQRNFVQLFPGARLFNERFLGMTKSFVVYGGWG
jgi:Methyltransferase domain